jgi:hypothetical protein
VSTDSPANLVKMDHIQASRIDPEHGKEETDKERKRGRNKIRNAAVAAANEVKGDFSDITWAKLSTH